VSYRFINGAEGKTIYELYLLVEFIVSQTLHSSQKGLRAIGKRSHEWTRVLQSKKQDHTKGDAESVFLDDEQIVSFRTFLDSLPDEIFEDLKERTKLQARMRKAAQRFLSAKKTSSIYVSTVTLKNLHHLLKKEGLETPQEGINFLLNFYIKKKAEIDS